MHPKRDADHARLVSSFRRGPCSPVKHILAPTDLTAQSKASVAYAVRLADDLNAKLTLLHVRTGSERADTPFSPLYTGQLEWDGRRVLEECQEAERTLRTMRDRIRAHPAPTEDCFLLGDPGPLILWVARECHVDLMVISASHFDSLDRLFAESNSDKILRDAPCPVLAVPLVLQEQRAAALDSAPAKARQLATDFAWAKEKP